MWKCDMGYPVGDDNIPMIDVIGKENFTLNHAKSVHHIIMNMI